MADTEGDGRTKPVVLQELVEAHIDDSTVARLAVQEELAEADTEGSDDPRLVVVKYPVGADKVISAPVEAFIKATT